MRRLHMVSILSKRKDFKVNNVFILDTVFTVYFSTIHHSLHTILKNTAFNKFKLTQKSVAF